jgi:hypothetical protein
MAELIIELVLWPFFGAIQAYVGIAWPSKDPEVRRLQRWTTWFFAIALVAVLAAVVMYYRSAGLASLAPVGVAYMSLLLAGFFGNQIEGRCKKQEKTHT